MVMTNAVVAADADGQVIIHGSARNILMNAWLSVPHHLLVFIPGLTALSEFGSPTDDLSFGMLHMLFGLLFGQFTIESI